MECHSAIRKVDFCHLLHLGWNWVVTMQNKVKSEGKEQMPDDFTNMWNIHKQVRDSSQ